jgi:hypothetical protein
LAWLDAVPAVPLLGLRWRHGYVVASERMAPLTQFLNKLQEKNRGLGYGNPSPWDTDIQATDGFEFKFHTDTMTIGFSYARAATIHHDERGLPELAKPPIRSYRELLEEVLTYTDAIVPLLASRPTAVNRLGVVATVPVRRDQAPPGLAEFLKRLDAVAGPDSISSSCRLLRRLRTEDGYEDRCHHNVRVLQGDDPHIVELVLDFQRYFDPEVHLDRLKGHAAPHQVAEDALGYFEAFGSGL